MRQKTYNILKTYLEGDGKLQTRIKNNCITVKLTKAKQAEKCGIRIINSGQKSPHAEIQGFYGDDIFRGYNVLAKIAELKNQQKDTPFDFNVELPYGFNKGRMRLQRKSIDVRIIKNNRGGALYVGPPEELEKLEEIKKAWEELNNIDKACANLQPKRRFIKIDSDDEVGTDKLNKYLSDKFSNLQELLENGTIGVTRPTGDEDNYKARLWVDEVYLNEHPEIFPEEDISDSYWTKTWKSPFEVNNQESCQYWLLVADPADFKFSDIKIDEQDFYTILNNEGNPRQKPWCYETAKAGDKLICYEASPIQKVVAFGEVCGKDDKHLYYKKTINLPIHLTRSELLEDSDLAKCFDSPHGSLLDLTETQYKKIQRMATKERNLIYFGAPGTGKSYLLKKEAERFEDSQSDTPIEIYGLTEYVERVTFHPEYTYFDFVGSYKPMMDGENIKYSFEPGPFARVLKKALSDPYKQYLLIIEEINRARVAAVFGDMFQLLDRDSNGKSEYFITPAKDLLAYLTTEEKDEAGNIIQQRAELEGGKLRLPANMFIWATMNSADQGVFPMDTAFKRRWSFKYVGIDESEKNIKGNCAEEWKELRKRINQLLQEAGINEDKQLGPFFLKETELEDTATFKEAFAEKVIMYLFEDAARHHRSHIFKSANLRYSAITDEFNGTPDSIFNTPKQQDSNTQKSGGGNT